MRDVRVGLATAGVLLLAAPLVLSLQAQQAASSPPSQIVTTATGEATVVPDRGMITFAVETRASTAAAAAAENARRQKRVIDALRAKGVAAERISTSGYSVSPDERFDDGQRRVVGYIARNAVVVDVHQIDQVGSLIDNALGAGANMVSGLRFYSTRFEEVRRSALQQAIERARGDAEVIAKAAGGTVGEALELSTNDAGMPRPMMEYADMRMASVNAAPETPINIGEQKVTVSVTTRWQFVPGRR